MVTRHREELRELNATWESALAGKKGPERGAAMREATVAKEALRAKQAEELKPMEAEVKEEEEREEQRRKAEDDAKQSGTNDNDEDEDNEGVAALPGGGVEEAKKKKKKRRKPGKGSGVARRSSACKRPTGAIASRGREQSAPGRACTTWSRGAPGGR